MRLKAECVAATAVSKVYEDAVKEDTEQYLGSDDPDNDDIPIDAGHGPSGLSVHVNDVTLNQPIVPAAEQSKGTLNPDAAEFVLPVTPLSRQVVDGDGGTSNHDIIECKDSITESHSKPQVAFWERLELRMSQPPPIPTPFDGDPAKYLRFRANFRDQVESKASLTDSEKMNYLMSYTTGRAKKVIENNQGLPNGCQLALLVLKERFGQNAMIVQALKSSVISGPKIRAGDSAALLALSDKVENCCWAMIELQSSELDCTTNLQQIFDRLPDHLQAKWRKFAKQYREENGGKEPTLKELSKFITAESQTENNPVYGRSSSAATKFNKPFFTPRVISGPKIPTLATEIQGEADVRLRKTSPAKENPDSKNGSSMVEVCKVCKGPHTIRKCSVFLSRGVAWCRRFARFNTLCY